MVLNEDMISLAIANNQICTIYDDNYVLLFKSMPVVDNQLEQFINSMASAKRDGINIATIVDHRLLEGHTSKFSNGSQYTKGVFLEERARGSNLDIEGIYLNAKKESYDFRTIAREYLTRLTAYITELEKRDSVGQEVFDKLVADYMALATYGIEPDPKPVNFFFDKSVGFTIIDPILKSEKYEEYKPYIAKQYIWGIVFGYGMPKISIGLRNYDFIPEDLKVRLDVTSSSLASKVVVALRKHGFYEDDIRKGLSDNVYKFLTKGEGIHLADLEIEIATIFAQVHQEEELKASQSSEVDWTFN